MCCYTSLDHVNRPLLIHLPMMLLSNIILFNNYHSMKSVKVFQCHGVTLSTTVNH